MSTIRLQKYLSEAGVASRRAGEALIRAGKVEVNGQVVRVLGTKIDPASDEVAVDGVPIQPRRKLYLAVHKPRGHVCTRRDEKGRPLLGDLLPKEWRHCYPVGRLDRESEGLIFVTNDGEFALRMTPCAIALPSGQFADNLSGCGVLGEQEDGRVPITEERLRCVQSGAAG